MNPRDEEIAQYAAAVRAALADIPDGDRDELVEDLEDHLAEVAAESSESLTMRLGAPESYAAELRTAYGAGPGKRRRTARGAMTDGLDRLERRMSTALEDHRVYAPVWAYVLELRPAWWLVRGYLVAAVIWLVVNGDPVPMGLFQLAITIGLMVGSAVLGVRARQRGERPRQRPRIVLLAALAIGAVVLFGVFGFSVGRVPNGEAYVGTPISEPHFGVGSGVGGGIANIYPFSKDGKPLRDILLYDQDGRPIQVGYEDEGLVLDQPCGSPPPIANSYPLPLRTMTQQELDEGMARTCATTQPTPAPGSTGTPSPPAPSPSPSPTG